ncbi:hypothetical protein KPH14_002364 [Odynerus spinipes]|uniref:Uncharacterized protein n=1 Tax=Odynerus spinipes TaxID=1348599 RepID=A0AAD9RLP1_9HYME|nr:hypothetical protein KPH14_002364 [Odynerus spinipes]
MSDLSVIASDVSTGFLVLFQLNDRQKSWARFVETFAAYAAVEFALIRRWNEKTLGRLGGLKMSRTTTGIRRATAGSSLHGTRRCFSTTMTSFPRSFGAMGLYRRRVEITIAKTVPTEGFRG